MSYTNAVIYFMSGTGNSYRAAIWLDELCRKQGINTQIIPVDSAAPVEEIKASPDTLVILAFPTHGLMPPWSVIKFIFSLPRKTGVRLFCLPTRGCFHISPVPIPGGSGLASFLPHLFLIFKGYRPQGSVSLDMPINMTSVHPRLTEKGIRRIDERAQRKLGKHASRLLAGKGVWFTRNNLWELLWAALPLYFIPLYPAAYLLMGKFFMGKIMFANNDCTGCGVCAKSCPNGALVMKGTPPRPYWRYNCEDCLRCLNFCPHKAIEAGTSWGAILALLSAIPASTWLLHKLSFYAALPAFSKDYFFLQVLNVAFYFPAVIAAYFIFSLALRLKPVNAFFTFTSLSHYFRRYHEPGTSLKNLLERKN